MDTVTAVAVVVNYVAITAAVTTVYVAVAKIPARTIAIL